MKKRILSVVIAAMMLIGVATGCTGGNSSSTASSGAESNSTTEAAAEETTGETGSGEGTFSAAMVTDVGGVNDESFNQSSWEGMLKLEAETGAKVSFIESQKDGDYSPNLEKKVDEAPDIIWGIGFMMKDAIGEAAENNPDQLFGLVDDAFPDGEHPNVISVVFQAEQSSFLVGYAAGMQTQTNRVGFIVGMESPVMDRFHYGYLAGVQQAAKERGIEIKTDYGVVESFVDTAKGKGMAQKMYNDGADVIFHAAGQSGSGVIEAAKELNKMVIGVDLDQNKLAPDNVITSALKNVGNAVFDVTKRVMDGEEMGGTTIMMGLKEGGVGIAPSSNLHLPAELLESIAALETKVVSGEIVVPYTEADYNAFIQ